MLDGYDAEFVGMLDRDAEGIGVWKCGEGMTTLTHPSDVTASFFLALLRGEYGARVLDPAHLVVVVNGSWSGGVRPGGIITHVLIWSFCRLPFHFMVMFTVPLLVINTK